MKFVRVQLVRLPEMSDQIVQRLQEELAERDRLIAAQNQIISDLSLRLQTDPMTNLLNRAGMSERMEGLISQQCRDGGALYVAFIDVDNFKSVNESFGHDGGDYALITIATRMKTVMRSYDLVSRWAGDEFAIAFSRPSAVNSAEDAVIGRLLDAVRQPITYMGFDMNCTISIGIICYTGQEYVSPVKLINLADEQMFNAKKSGKDMSSLANFQAVQLF